MINEYHVKFAREAAANARKVARQYPDDAEIQAEAEKICDQHNRLEQQFRRRVFSKR